MLAALCAVLSQLGRFRVTLVYTAGLAAVAIVVAHLAPGVRESLLRGVSTNLRNLGDGKLETLVGSAFVNEAGPVYMWLPGLVAVLALGELVWLSSSIVDATDVGMSYGAVAVMGTFVAAVGTRLGPPPQKWTAPRCALLVVAAAFSCLLMAYGDLTLTATAALGLAGASVGQAVRLLAQTNSSADASIQSDSQASGGESSNSPGISHS